VNPHFSVIQGTNDQMNKTFLVDLVSFVHLVYLVNEMNEKNQIDQTNEIGVSYLEFWPATNSAESI
jgi:hypothetical protein